MISHQINQFAEVKNVRGSQSHSSLFFSKVMNKFGIRVSMMKKVSVIEAEARRLQKVNHYSKEMVL
jgi:hypothetical protein